MSFFHLKKEVISTNMYDARESTRIKHIVIPWVTDFFKECLLLDIGGHRVWWTVVGLNFIVDSARSLFSLAHTSFYKLKAARSASTSLFSVSSRTAFDCISWRLHSRLMKDCSLSPRSDVSINIQSKLKLAMASCGQHTQDPHPDHDCRIHPMSC